MLGLKSTVRFDDRKVRRAKQRAALRYLYRAAAWLRLVAKRSIRKRKGPAPEGDPPHTQTKRLPRSLRYAVDPRHERAVIGPDYAIIRDVGGAHEHGGRFRDETYEPRPFMGPALEKTEAKLPEFWEDSVR